VPTEHEKKASKEHLRVALDKMADKASLPPHGAVDQVLILLLYPIQDFLVMRLMWLELNIILMVLNLTRSGGRRSG
jgi:hypothetical protein